jgi:hypothetical protein
MHMFDGLTSNVSESDRGNAGQLAFGVMRLNGGDEALGVRWQLEREDAKREPTTVTLTLLDHHGGVIFEFFVMLTPRWDKGFQHILDLEQGVRIACHYECDRPPLGAGYHRAIAEIYRVMDELCAIHDLSLEEGWHSQLGIELMVPAGAFVYEED